ncbi:response regulator transcription factor [Microbacterium sp. BWT-B31]|uniref:response regulator n=1 Tax=Microbacterium sp. BWT-B31 TaxID=3232072 RepID=UPI0035274C8D
MIRVLVVEDEELVRAGIVRLLSTAPDLETVGEGADGAEAIALVRELHPDVVLLDMRMPVLDGLDAIIGIRREHPEVAIVVLTSYLTDEYLVPALRAGAVGFLLKESTPEELKHGIRDAAAGNSVLSPAAARRLLMIASASASGGRAAAREALYALAPQERAVVSLVAEGLSNADIARRLFLAESTVKAYLAGAMTKLGTSNRTQTAILALEADLDAV